MLKIVSVITFQMLTPSFDVLFEFLGSNHLLFFHYFQNLPISHNAKEDTV